MNRGQPNPADTAAGIGMNPVVNSTSMVTIDSTTLVVDVVGTPAPQGSKSYKGHRGGRPVLVESSAAVGPWRDAVAWAVRSAMARTGYRTIDGPVGR